MGSLVTVAQINNITRVFSITIQNVKRMIVGNNTKRGDGLGLIHGCNLLIPGLENFLLL